MDGHFQERIKPPSSGGRRLEGLLGRAGGSKLTTSHGRGYGFTTALPPTAAAPPKRRSSEPLRGGPSAGEKFHQQRTKPFRLTAHTVLPPVKSFVPSLGLDQGSILTACRRKYTNVSRCCSKCLPIGWKKYYSEEVESSGLQNVLAIGGSYRKHWLWSRLLPNVYHSLCIPMNYSTFDYRKNTLNSERVRDAIEQCATTASLDYGSDAASNTVAVGARKEQEERARSIVYRMSSRMSKSLLRAAFWFLLWAFGRLYRHVYIQKGHALMLHQAQERNVPMVFLPCHRSHQDYLLLSFILVGLGIKAPHIAAGDNLNIPIFSWLIHHLGGFFVKRRLDSPAGRDILYRKCLHEHMAQLLMAGQNISFYVEGSRSRSGKPSCCPKAGLLSVLVDCVREGIVSDIILVPVGISYDRILERKFVKHELMGGSKEPETFLQALKGAWRMLTTSQGSARMDFGQPFSLQEYLSSASLSSKSLPAELHSSGRTRSCSLTATSSPQRGIITALSYHIVYDSTLCSAVMPTCMVALLLLCRHREGVKFSELVESYGWLEDFASTKGRAVGFPGRATEAVQYAVHYMDGLVRVSRAKQRNGIITVRSGKQSSSLLNTNGLTSGGRHAASSSSAALSLSSPSPSPSSSSSSSSSHSHERTVVCPVLDLPGVFDLLHLSNQVTPMLAMEAVIACSIHKVVGNEDFELKCKEVELAKDKLVEEALFLCKLLAREYIFAPPCVDLSCAVNDMIESFMTSDVLTVSKQSYSRGRKHCVSLGDVGDPWGERERSVSMVLKRSCDVSVMEYLWFLRQILASLLEAYWLVGLNLLQIMDEKPIEEVELIEKLHGVMVEKANRGVLNRVESCSVETIRNAVKTYVDMELLSISSSVSSITCSSSRGGSGEATGQSHSHSQSHSHPQAHSQSQPHSQSHSQPQSQSQGVVLADAGMLLEVTEIIERFR